MPLYEYECDACGRRFERIQKFSDPPVTVCPHCAGSVRKLLSSPAIQFKGSGFYITDYARSGSKEGGKPADSPAPAGTSSENTKSSAPADSGSGETAKKAEPAKPSSSDGPSKT